MFILTAGCPHFLSFASVLAPKCADFPTRPFALHHRINSDAEPSICGTSACTTTQTQMCIRNVDVRHIHKMPEPLVTVFIILT
jgi:hypothetical protein